VSTDDLDHDPIIQTGSGLCVCGTLASEHWPKDTVLKAITASIAEVMAEQGGFASDDELAIAVLAALGIPADCPAPLATKTEWGYQRTNGRVMSLGYRVPSGEAMRHEMGVPVTVNGEPAVLVQRTIVTGMGDWTEVPRG
jgi:hypothetical protein